MAGIVQLEVGERGREEAGREERRGAWAVRAWKVGCCWPVETAVEEEEAVEGTWVCAGDVCERQGCSSLVLN